MLHPLQPLILSSSVATLVWALQANHLDYQVLLPQVTLLSLGRFTAEA